MKSAIRKNKYWKDVKVSAKDKKAGIKRLLVPTDELNLTLMMLRDLEKKAKKGMIEIVPNMFVPKDMVYGVRFRTKPKPERKSK